MLPAPAPGAILSDALWCLGLGCLLGLARDALALAFGSGPVRGFVWDLLAFAAAAVLVCGVSAGVSAGGMVRWYMALAMGAGALCWRITVQPAVHRALRGLLRALTAPFRLVQRRLLAPLRAALAAAWARRRARLHKKMAEKVRKIPKSGKKRLQKQSKVLYN